MASKITKDPETLYNLIVEYAEMADFNWRNLPTLAELRDELSWSDNTTRNYLEKLKSDDEIEELSIEEGSRRFIPSYMEQELFTDPNNIQDQINNTVNELRSRILRNPTIEEVAEELRVEVSNHFKQIFRRNVDQEWRSPREDIIEEKREEVQDYVEEAVKIYLYGNDDTDHINSFTNKDSLKYYKDNKELIEDSEIQVKGDKRPDQFPSYIAVKASGRLRKFMENPEFFVTMSRKHEYEDERVTEITERIWDKLEEHNNA